MMTSALSRRWKAACRYRGSSTGDDEARSNWRAQLEPSPDHHHPTWLALTTARRSCSPASSIAALDRLGAAARTTPRCPNRHRARGTLSAHRPAGSFPGGFRTPAPACGDVRDGPASETLHTSGSAAVERLLT